MALLELHNLVKHFPVRRAFLGKTRDFVHAVNGVTLSVEKGETLGVVGESGCGKTTLGRVAIRLMEPDSGRIVFDGTDITKFSRKELIPFRRRMQIVFQDPFSSLNPRMNVGDIIAEPLLIHKICRKNEKYEKVAALLEEVGLEKNHAYRYPHEFSGGQRQRICIARALSLKPDLIIADEPVSSLDVAVQEDILKLLKDLQARFGLSYLFISHDLRVVKHLSHRIAVMYLGNIVELFKSSDLENASHPYTSALLSAVPVADPEVKKKREILAGDVPSPINPPKGCPFHPRCRYKEDICEKTLPVLEDKGSGHLIACHFHEKVRSL